jgi:hypothetical protein
MKLHHIIEKQLDIPRSKKAISGIIQNKNTHVLGSGIQAIAYAHKKHPNSIVKAIAVSGKDDPAYQFLRICVNHPDNPFFPTVYKAKMYNTREMSDSELEFVEAQLSLGMAPEESLYQILCVVERLKEFSLERGTTQCEILANLGIVKFRKVDNNNIGAFRVEAANVFKTKESRSLLYQRATDPQLKQALKLLEPLFNKYDPDMHLGNVMLRGTQLVIVDPVSRIYDYDD